MKNINNRSNNNSNSNNNQGVFMPKYKLEMMVDFYRERSLMDDNEAELQRKHANKYGDDDSMKRAYYAYIKARHSRMKFLIALCALRRHQD